MIGINKKQNTCVSTRIRKIPVSELAGFLANLSDLSDILNVFLHILLGMYEHFPELVPVCEIFPRLAFF